MCLCGADHFAGLGHAHVPSGGFICQRFCRAGIVGPRSSSAEQTLPIQQSRAKILDLLIKLSRWPRATGGRSCNAGRAKIGRLRHWPACSASKPLRFPPRTPAAILSALANKLAIRIVSIVDIPGAFFNVYRGHALARASPCFARLPQIPLHASSAMPAVGPPGGRHAVHGPAECST